MRKSGRLLERRAGAWGTAIAVWNLWKRIPPKQRKRLIGQARKHGPRLVKEAVKARRKTASTERRSFFRNW